MLLVECYSYIFLSLFLLVRLILQRQKIIRADEKRKTTLLLTGITFCNAYSQLTMTSSRKPHLILMFVNLRSRDFWSHRYVYYHRFFPHYSNRHTANAALEGYANILKKEVTLSRIKVA